MAEDDDGFLISREARERDENRIRRFEENQRRTRRWIKFSKIAEWVSELGGSGPNEAAREKAFTMLQEDLLDGHFGKGDDSQVLFLFPGVSRARRMTPQWLQDAIDHNYDNQRGRLWLQNCWLPRNLFERWCEWHHLPKSAPRFQPSQKGRGRGSPEGAERSAEPPMPAPMLAPQRASKLAVNIVDQTDVPAAKASNKGGRPPAVDWEPLEDALVKEIEILGFPERRNPPGWRGTKDVADWIEKTFPKDVEKVARRTIEDHVRRIIRDLKAAAKPVSR